ncbi:MAG: hypothetical protein COW00_19680 [Bdellovibrio sp. CG12_big_fil_rev_8_21_14_0_65_39_13]|nr:MAG: hypothetical protein COW78_01855 [Bdellovibrio sp. CG22_combo_CG10-13_8_21_14_all_39_27]PIQ57596.1 MAG: hypothetical protein COW00_19680 [Bdellovibrio sp. CG12_big_fil_rev_8_21_14_0_65_39_13]PIR35760.1 MAG: hypothetical protein COV37_06060 [Bdellovibrio sp. CG11_big_fil_rev_8_21_14_0_20_39_38]
MTNNDKIDSTKFTLLIETGIQEFENHLPPRIHLLLNDWLQFDLKAQSNVSFFLSIIKLIARADRSPAHIISELLPIIDLTRSDELKKNTHSTATAFIRDFLKNEFILRKIEKS